jgi:hypothetical protein
VPLADSTLSSQLTQTHPQEDLNILSVLQGRDKKNYQNELLQRYGSDKGFIGLIGPNYRITNTNPDLSHLFHGARIPVPQEKPTKPEMDLIQQILLRLFGD